jgi:hypothetical protein
MRARLSPASIPSPPAHGTTGLSERPRTLAAFFRSLLRPVDSSTRPHRPGGGGTTSCTPGAPGASIDNTWAWVSPGSWGMPGQQVTYAINVFNNDVGCGSSSFAVTLSAPDGFSVSMPTSTITLKSASTGYVWAYVTSPVTAAAGNYPLTVTVERAGSSSPPATSW